MLGALLALASAATFGLNNAAVRRGVLTSTVLQAMAITVPMGVPLFALACLLFGGFQALSEFNSSQWLWMMLAGIVHFIIGRYGNYRSTKAMGANLSSPVQQLSVPISIVLAMIYLDEVLTPLRLIGFIMVMVGPVIMLHRKKGQGVRKTASGFTPHYTEGFMWGFVSSFAYGASPLFIMMGLQSDGSLVDSIAGGFISYSFATIVVFVLLILAGGARFMSSLDGTAAKWFVCCLRRSGLFFPDFPLYVAGRGTYYRRGPHTAPISGIPGDIQLAHQSGTRILRFLGASGDIHIHARRHPPHTQHRAGGRDTPACVGASSAPVLALK